MNFEPRNDSTLDTIILVITLFCIAVLFLIMLDGCTTPVAHMDCDWYCPVEGEIPQDCYCLDSPHEKPTDRTDETEF